MLSGMAKGSQDPAAASGISIMIQAESERIKMVGAFCFLKKIMKIIILVMYERGNYTISPYVPAIFTVAST